MTTNNKRPMNKRFGNIIPKVLLAALLLSGGAAMAQRNEAPHVSVSGNVFGGGRQANVKGSTSVVIDQSDAIIGTDVYGGGEEAKVNTIDGTNYTQGKSASVTLQKGTVQGNVFGGGRGTTGIAADVLGPTRVTINGGTVITGVYGANNINGKVHGNVVVDVFDGTIGSAANLNQETPVVAMVCGGGYGEQTNTSGNVTVNIGNASTGPTLYADVYGGSAFGNVNTQGGTNTTTVNIINGTLETNAEAGHIVHHIGNHDVPVDYTIYHGGNVFGGGLGRKAEGEQGQTGYVSPIESKVYGDVAVNIGAGTVLNSGFSITTEGYATIKGNIYGCNDQNGAPQKEVSVNVFATAHTSKNEYNYVYVYLNDTTANTDATFALANVFGGSRQADFLTGKVPQVNIYGCDNTIRRTFGGSDAAASKSVNTMIQGGGVYQAFGGGNGEVSPANVNGTITIGIHGGKVHSSFGRSNLQGSSGAASITTDSDGGCGTTEITEFFGGGNFADVEGDIDATVYCADGLFIENLYGGCKQADVLPSGNEIGNVHLVVEGGTYNNIFGGSQGRLEGTDPTHPGEESADINGSILLEIHGGKVNNAIYGGSHILGKVKGTITINIEDKGGNCPLDVSTADVYGGGNEADYDTTPTTGSNEYPYTHPNYPVINIRNAKVKNVYGGGYKANVKGNPQIHLKQGAKVLGNVYGGGNMGVVDGSPRVIVNGEDDSENPHEIPTPSNE